MITTWFKSRKAKEDTKDFDAGFASVMNGYFNHEKTIDAMSIIHDDSDNMFHHGCNKAICLLRRQAKEHAFYKEAKANPVVAIDDLVASMIVGLHEVVSVGVKYEEYQVKLVWQVVVMDKTYSATYHHQYKDQYRHTFSIHKGVNTPGNTSLSHNEKALMIAVSEGRDEVTLGVQNIKSGHPYWFKAGE